MRPPQLEKSWAEVLKDEWNKPYLHDLMEFLKIERASSIPIYPEKEDVFSAFNHTPFDAVKVVIVGQDPYHGKGQAHGLSFSVRPQIPKPPSLKNIFKELKSDLGIEEPKHGCLISWAKQGVMMLNAVLTVRENQPGSHHGKGWEKFTDAALSQLSKRKDIVFVLWGKAAQEKCKNILGDPVLLAAHPSPYSAQRFLGCKHFSKINEQLKSQGKEPINWTII